MGGAVHKVRLVDRDDVRYVHYARLRKVGLAFLQKHVARRVRPVQIRGNQAHHARCNRAPVENIVLDNHARMRSSEVKPIYFYLPNLAHQRSLAVRRTLALMPFSRRLSASSTLSA